VVAVFSEGLPRNVFSTICSGHFGDCDILIGNCVNDSDILVPQQVFSRSIFFIGVIHEERVLHLELTKVLVALLTHLFDVVAVCPNRVLSFAKFILQCLQPLLVAPRQLLFLVQILLLQLNPQLIQPTLILEF